MLTATEWMAVPSYLGIDRLLYEPCMILAQRAFDASPNRYIRGFLCYAAGLLRLALSILPVHILLHLPVSNFILVLLVFVDFLVHPFAATADAIHGHDTKSILSERFLRLLAASQITMFPLVLLKAVHGIHLRQWLLPHLF